MTRRLRHDKRPAVDRKGSGVVERADRVPERDQQFAELADRMEQRERDLSRTRRGADFVARIRSL